MHNGVSVVICTYNRSELLKECLESFTMQTIFPENLEFLVIDNYSDGKTRDVVTLFQSRIPGLRYIVENNTGLSYARNKGIEESNYDWICYTDDDAKVHVDFLERLFYMKDNFQFDAFGGMFYPWYRTAKPHWFPNDFGQLRMIRKTTGALEYGQSIAGGISAFKKEKLIEAGKFPTDIGMRGDIVGYGEEDFVIKQMWQNGCVIGFDPLWKMDHLVAEYKYTLKWQLKRSFAKGRDAQLKKGALSFTAKCSAAMKALITMLYLFLKNTVWFFKKKYYLENYILDSMRYSCRLFGKVSV